MPNKLKLLKKVIDKLEAALDTIAQQQKREITESFLRAAHTLWYQVDEYSGELAYAKDLYDLSEYLSDYYLDIEDDDYSTLEEALATILQAVKNKYSQKERYYGFGFDDTTDEESDSNSDENNDSDIEDEDAPNNTPLTREIIKGRINFIFDNIDIKYGFYNLFEELSENEINTPKWKTYLYLRKCVLDFRRGKPQEFNSLIAFLEKNNDNKEWLAGKLLDPSQKSVSDKWGSGNHEWLERCLIIDVLKRSAGLVVDVEPETSLKDANKNIDWLYVQARLRSDTKYILFKNEEQSIQYGHPGAVKLKITAKGFCSKGSPGFHHLLVAAFRESTSLAGFITRANNIFKQGVISGKKKINADGKKRVLVDGSNTNEQDKVEAFRKEKLKPMGYSVTNQMFKRLMHVTTQYRDEPCSVSPVDSENSDESTPRSQLR